MSAVTEIPITDEALVEELQKLQSQLAQLQNQTMELVLKLAAFGALPTSLQQAAQKTVEVLKAREDKVKKHAALAGVDLDSPDHVGKWAWSTEDNMLRKVR